MSTSKDSRKIVFAIAVAFALATAGPALADSTELRGDFGSTHVTTYQVDLFDYGSRFDFGGQIERHSSSTWNSWLSSFGGGGFTSLFSHYDSSSWLSDYQSWCRRGHPGSPVPEPTAAAVFALGAFFVARATRRRA